LIILRIENGLNYIPKAVHSQKRNLIINIEFIYLTILEWLLRQMSILVNDQLEERNRKFLSIGKVNAFELTLSVFWLLHILHVEVVVLGSAVIADVVIA